MDKRFEKAYEDYLKRTHLMLFEPRSAAVGHIKKIKDGELIVLWADPEKIRDPVTMKTKTDILPKELIEKINQGEIKTLIKIGNSVMFLLETCRSMLIGKLGMSGNIFYDGSEFSDYALAKGLSGFSSKENGDLLSAVKLNVDGISYLKAVSGRDYARSDLRKIPEWTDDSISLKSWQITEEKITLIFVEGKKGHVLKVRIVTTSDSTSVTRKKGLMLDTAKNPVIFESDRFPQGKKIKPKKIPKKIVHELGKKNLKFLDFAPEYETMDDFLEEILNVPDMLEAGDVTKRSIERMEALLGDYLAMHI